MTNTRISFDTNEYQKYTSHYSLYLKDDLIKLHKALRKRVLSLFHKVSSHNIKNNIKHESLWVSDYKKEKTEDLIMYVSKLKVLEIAYRKELKRLKALTYWQRLKLRFSTNTQK